jgi:asparagine synthase (glutamine-hydrolysing)
MFKADPLNQRLYLDFHYNNLPGILRNFDRCSMASGVESRAPLLDWRLVCYCHSLPSTSKIGGAYSRRIFRDAMKSVIPNSIRTRNSKIGFGSPIADWMKNSRLKEYMLDISNSQKFIESSIWNGIEINKFLESAIATENFIGAGSTWAFIQASRLIELFESRKVS